MLTRLVGPVRPVGLFPLSDVDAAEGRENGPEPLFLHKPPAHSSGTVIFASALKTNYACGFFRRERKNP